MVKARVNDRRLNPYRAKKHAACDGVFFVCPTSVSASAERSDRKRKSYNLVAILQPNAHDPAETADETESQTALIQQQGTQWKQRTAYHGN
jgi:hypothetical protein